MAAGAVVVERVIVVMSSEQAAANSTAKANDNPNSEKKLSLRRTMLILDIMPVHYKAYFLTAFLAAKTGKHSREICQRSLPGDICQEDLPKHLLKRGPPGARTQHLEVKSLLLYPMS